MNRISLTIFFLLVLVVTAAVVGQEPTHPTITQEPASQTVPEDSTATFALVATGTAPLLYQWQKNDSAITGAVATSYTTPAVTFADSGTRFRCIVSNLEGSDTSVTVYLGVTLKVPVITAEPVSDTVIEGTPASFTIAAKGTNLHYAWFKNNAVIATAPDSASYVIAAAPYADSGSRFCCVVTNAAGSDTSAEATLHVTLNVPVITVEPIADTTVEGSAASFGLTAVGNNLHYQWLKNGTVITGAPDSAILTTAAVTLADSGSLYSCIVSNSAGSDTSVAVGLVVTLLPPEVTVDPANQSVIEGATATFSVTATGSRIHYQWQKNQKTIAGAADSSVYMTPAAVMADTNAKFRCIVSNSAGRDTSAEALLTVAAIPPVITEDLRDTSAREGQRFTFRPKVTGTKPMTFVWYKND
ncbi:MAG: hypothetical protein JW795_12875, partial [Chitinivibrionales bacterium]|nr:hypothetical protein [Chitinivibrionales bacterium]